MNLYKRALIQRVDMLLEEQVWRDTLYHYLKMLRNGEFVEEQVEAVMQKFHGKFDIYDAYAYSRFHTMFCDGSLGCIRVKFGATPRADVEVEYHNSVLRPIESSPFHGEFWGGLADYDGNFSWSTEVSFEVLNCSVTDRSVDRKRVKVPPGTLPLEVGYTEGATTLAHILWRGGVARWPYGHEEIRVFKLMDESLLAANALSSALDDRCSGSETISSCKRSPRNRKRKRVGKADSTGPTKEMTADSDI